MNDILSMFKQTLEMEAKALGTPDKTTINRALELCASAYQLGTEEHDWDALRNQAAIAAMQGILSNNDTMHAAVCAADETMSAQVVVARNAIAYADALVQELKANKE